ncbi:MAG: HAMP domain-containing histidine kinase [bacterium]|nr:HAMP domain-containing histidine kinase [bacterium]
MNGPYIDSLFYAMTPRAIVTPTYQTGSLYLKTAFAPLLGEDSSVMAVVGVEANVDYFEDLASLRQNLLYATAVSTVGGLILGLLFLALQQRLNRAEQQLFLGETHAYLGRMVAVVSHELKNPLMIIRGSAERLRKKTGAEEATYILEETDRLNNIVSGYLAFAKADGPLLVGESTESFDLAELLNSAAKHLGERFADQQITWTEPLPATELAVTGYRRSLRQVILNLMVNGVEGCLAAGKPVAMAMALTGTARNTVEIKITNFGVELSDKEIQKIFTPFHTTKQTGSGLGLYISRKLIEEMGGKLTLTSSIGSGAVTALIELPKQAK